MGDVVVSTLAPSAQKEWVKARVEDLMHGHREFALKNLGYRRALERIKQMSEEGASLEAIHEIAVEALSEANGRVGQNCGNQVTWAFAEATDACPSCGEPIGS